VSVSEGLQGSLYPDLEIALGVGNGGFYGLRGLLESVGGHLSGSALGIRVQVTPSHKQIMTAEAPTTVQWKTRSSSDAVNTTDQLSTLAHPGVLDLWG
jgi:hypothetical protein